MKRIYLLILISTLFYFTPTFSQHVVATNRKWTVPDNFASLTLYFFNGDTIIGNELCKKLFAAYDSTYAISYYQGAMREDSTGKVYYNGNLLYDFSLNVGDAFAPSWMYPYHLEVLSIDTIVLLNGESRRRMNMSDEEYWIEGIGSTNGLTNVAYSWFIFDYWVALNCFFENDSLKYQGVPNLPCYDRLLGVENISDSKKFEVYPNPFSEKTVIEFYHPVVNATLKIFDQSGREVKVITNLSGEKITLNRNELSPGLFYFCLYEKDMLTRGKIIIE